MDSRLFVHLSDIHFDAKSTTTRGPNLAARHLLLDDLQEGVAALGRPDAVLVTGDIAFSGQEEEYVQAKAFLQEVTDALEIAAEQVQVVPGNHDVDRKAVKASVQMAHAALRSAEQPEVDHNLNALLSEVGEPLFAPLAEYNRFAGAYECAVGNASPYWENEWSLGKALTLCLRGLTTVLISDAEDRRANLLIGTTQTSLAVHPPTTVVAVLGHHPPDWWQDMDEAEAGMRRFAHVHLYGHKHVHHLSVIDDSVRLVAGAVHPERQSDWRPRYNWLRLQAEGEDGPDPRLVVEVWPRVMVQVDNDFRSDSAGGAWEPDVRQVALGRLARVTRRRNGEDVDGELGATETATYPDETTVFVVPELAARSPMTQSDGRPTPLRQAVYRFMALGFAEQTAILSDLDLITDADRDAPPHEQFQRAFRRAAEAGRVEELTARISASHVDDLPQTENQ
jgi:predicted phosphodiesterase